MYHLNYIPLSAVASAFVHTLAQMSEQAMTSVCVKITGVGILQILSTTNPVSTPCDVHYM